MLLNRARESFGRLRPRTRRLAGRGRARGRRPPVVLVPSILGTRLADRRGRILWGSLPRLYAGPPIGTAVSSTAGLLTGFPLLPGLLDYDVFGGLVRFLERVGGYRLGHDLHALEYDWRTGIAAAAGELADLIDRVTRADRPADRPIDLVCVSTGGLAARYYLAAQSGAASVRRVVYVGTPHRGAFIALSYLAQGVRPAPLGRSFRGREVAELQTAWDALPHPDEKVFADPRGRPLDLDLYSADTWVGLGLDPGVPDLAERLARTRRLHAELEQGSAHPEAFVIGARHLPTLSRCIVRGDRAFFPPCAPPRRGPAIDGIYQRGDSALSEHTQCAVPGLSPARTWFVEPAEHRLLPADPSVHHRVVEALLAA